MRMFFLVSSISFIEPIRITARENCRNLISLQNSISDQLAQCTTEVRQMNLRFNRFFERTHPEYSLSDITMLRKKFRSWGAISSFFVPIMCLWNKTIQLKSHAVAIVLQKQPPNISTPSNSLMDSQRRAQNMGEIQFSRLRGYFQLKNCKENFPGHSHCAISLVIAYDLKNQWTGIPYDVAQTLFCALAKCKTSKKYWVEKTQPLPYLELLCQNNERRNLFVPL